MCGMSSNIPTWYQNHNQDIHSYTVLRKKHGCEKWTYIYWIFFQCATWVCNSECSRSRDFIYLGVSLVSQKILYILVSASCQLCMIKMRRRIFVDMETRSIRIFERATPYHITQLRSIISPPTSPLQVDDKCAIVNLNYTLMINLQCLHLNLIKA